MKLKQTQNWNYERIRVLTTCSCHGTFAYAEIWLVLVTSRSRWHQLALKNLSGNTDNCKEMANEKIMWAARFPSFVQRSEHQWISTKYPPPCAYLDVKYYYEHSSLTSPLFTSILNKRQRTETPKNYHPTTFFDETKNFSPPWRRHSYIVGTLIMM